MYWSGTGSLVAITSGESFYILRFDRDAYNAKVEEGAEITDEGVEEAFDVVVDIPERCVSHSNITEAGLTRNYSVKTGKWVGDCFMYTTASNRLCYFVGAESYTISPFDAWVVTYSSQISLSLISL